jgi:transcriptional regulator with XRE-family HTH domain
MPAKTRRSRKIAGDDRSAELRALFGANLRRARQKADLTQEDVRARTGIRQHYVSEVENGAHNVTLGTMASLADAVGVEVRHLLRPRRTSGRKKGASGIGR